MLTLEQKQRWRELILSEVYDRTGGDQLNGLMPSDMLEGITPGSGTDPRSYLHSECDGVAERRGAWEFDQASGVGCAPGDTWAPLLH